MSSQLAHFLTEHRELSRRYFLRLGAAGTAAASVWPTAAHAEPASSILGRPELAESLAKLESFFTPPAKFRDVSRGKPLPHSLPDEKKREVGLTRETWKLEVISDPENPAKLGRELTKADGTALDFAGLLKLGEKHAVRFAKVMTCLNIGCPLGMGIWEGVPLREVLWLTQPREDLRRVFYYGYHNDDPAADVPKLAAARPRAGRPVRPAAGHSVLQAQRPVARQPARRAGARRRARGLRLQVDQVAVAHRADEPGRTPTTPTPAATTTSIARSRIVRRDALVPRPRSQPDQPIPVTGYAQVGISGLSKVQVWIAPERRRVAGRRQVFRHRAVDRRRDSRRRRKPGAATCPRRQDSRRARSASTPPASRRPGRCGWAKSTGRRLLPGPACRRLHAPLAARSTRRESPSRCRARSANPATRRLRR